MPRISSNSPTPLPLHAGHPGVGQPELKRRYAVGRSDSVGDLRVEVRECVPGAAAPGRVRWWKDRLLTQYEVLDLLIDPLTARPTHAIHRPLRPRQQGWYIVLRTASPAHPHASAMLVPDGDGVGFRLVLSSSASRGVPHGKHQAERVLGVPGVPEGVGSSTNLVGPEAEEASSSATPLSPTDQLHPPNQKQRAYSIRPGTILAPEQCSAARRLLASLSTRLFPPKDFTISPLPSPLPSPLSPVPPSSSPGPSSSPFLTPTLTRPKEDTHPLLVFRDSTPPWLGSATRGVFELDGRAVEDSGLGEAWWVAVGLAMVEYWEEKEGWEAGQEDT